MTAGYSMADSLRGDGLSRSLAMPCFPCDC